MKKILFVIPFFLALFSCHPDKEKKPNILFIMSDDHTSQAVGVYGGRLQQLNPTPTIDKLANEGIVMDNAFCSNAICTPSRACIMTGQFSAVNGVTDLAKSLPVEQHYLAQEMKKAGYETAIVGKWHLHVKPESFDYYKVLPEQGHYFNPVFYERGATGTVTRPHFKETRTYEGVTEMEGHSSDCIASSAIEWFKRGRKTDKPFFMKLHFKAPHDIFENAPRYESYLEDVHIPEPESMWDAGNNGSIATRGHNDELVNYIGTSISSRNKRRNYVKLWANDPDLTEKEATAKAYQVYMKKYLRCVKGVDDNVKRVIDYLQQEGMLDNTLIVYTGDQGFYLGEHDYMDKRWGYDEGMRMPFIVRYPKSIPAGSRSDAIVENVDYPAMLLDYAGVSTPEYMHGKSFRSIMETGTESANWKTAAYYHYWMHMKHHDNPAHIGIRTKTHKLLYFYGCTEVSDKAQTPPAWELYDLVNDPKEMNNIYDSADPSIIAGLKGQLKVLRQQYGEDNPKYACNKVIDQFWDYTESDKATAIEISHQVLMQKQKKQKK